MNLVQAVQDYVTRMVSDIPGMKVLLLDTQTTGIVSMVYSQSQILQKEVFLVEHLSTKDRDTMLHLKAVCFLRPEDANIKLLAEELKNPKYGEYHLYFSNILRPRAIEDLAQADEQEVVKHVQEIYADYFAVNPDLFTLNIPSCVCLQAPEWNETVFQLMRDGVSACLLSLKKKPVVRYQATSQLARRLAQEISLRMEEEKALFEFRRPDTAPILLILDRRDDPVTPLLNQWTYQAMVHELLGAGIKNNRVSLANVPSPKDDLKEVVLSPLQDQFYKENMFGTFGDLGAAVKALVDEYQSKTKLHRRIESIADMQNFVESYPEFRKLSGNVTKHVALIGELSRLVDHKALLEVSELEQELACQMDHSSALKGVMGMIGRPNLDPMDKVRVVMLYALRYHDEPTNQLKRMIALLESDTRIKPEQVKLVEGLLKYCDAGLRSGELFANKTSFVRRGLDVLHRGVKGVANVYTQHQPLLAQTLDALIKGKIKEASYPIFPPTNTPMGATRVQDIIVFMVGGTTYEEAKTVYQMNQNNMGVRIVIGGTTIHNYASFCADIEAFNNLMQGKDSFELQATEANGIAGRVGGRSSQTPPPGALGLGSLKLGGSGYQPVATTPMLKASSSRPPT